MAILFPSDEWVKAMMLDLNQSDAYAAAAKNWEGDFLFIVQPHGSLDHTVGLYMDLYHGKCNSAYAVTDLETVKPVFRLTGVVPTWKLVMTKKLDPMQAMMTGKLKLQGNMSIVMRNVRAAKELVESCTRIDTLFPE